MSSVLRTIDAGTVGPERSQGLWHGIASAMQPGAAPVLSLCRPSSPYVCIGYHRHVAEVDLEACRRDGVPVLRRQIGGGPVWIDSDQLFFQITMPRRSAPARVAELYAELLSPAVAAFRALGLDARLAGMNDIAVGDRKISGTGAGQIGEAVTVVGNLLFRFPHERMVAALALPSATARAECLRLMRRHVTSVEGEGRSITVEQARDALVDAYARRLGAAPAPSALDAAEQAAVDEWDERVGDPTWVAGPARPPPARVVVKICEGVYYHAEPAREPARRTA